MIPRSGVSGMLLFAAMCLGSSGCVGFQRLDTPSGKPEILIAGKTRKQVADAIVNRALTKGWTIKSTDQYNIVVRKQLDGFGALFFGSGWNPYPDGRITYTLIESEPGIRVVAHPEVVTNPGSAYEQTTDASQGRTAEDLQQALEEIAASLKSQSN